MTSADFQDMFVQTEMTMRKGWASLVSREGGQMGLQRGLKGCSEYLIYCRGRNMA